MRLVCFGDSNTYGYDPRSYFGGRYPAEHRWVDLLAQKMGCKVVNAGENGREIPRCEGELQRFQRLLKTNQPLDLLIIMLGTNDLLEGLSPETTATRMEKFLTDMGFPKQRILLIAPPPLVRGAWVPDQALIDKSVVLGSAYHSLSERLRISYAGQWQIPMTFDGVHFTEAGHEEFARNLLDVIRTLTLH